MSKEIDEKEFSFFSVANREMEFSAILEENPKNFRICVYFSDSIHLGAICMFFD